VLCNFSKGPDPRTVVRLLLLQGVLICMKVELRVLSESCPSSTLTYKDSTRVWLPPVSVYIYIYIYIIEKKHTNIIALMNLSKASCSVVIYAVYMYGTDIDACDVRYLGV
jgi:hypothetical protein